MHLSSQVSCRVIVRLTCLIAPLLTAAGLFAAAAPSDEQAILIKRLRTQAERIESFDSVHKALYQTLLPWYETWGTKITEAVDSNMIAPDVYAKELADSLEQGKNFIADNPRGVFPMVFEKTLPSGKKCSYNYFLTLPADYTKSDRKFPLIIGLHGTGWLAHKISFIRTTIMDSRTFSVTPINEAGPWQLDFLNAYLDELLARFPIDPDQVYLEGHSLGAMGVWDWALNNPERFAAISPRSGIGEPYRAPRLRDLPAWVIHGSRDDVVSPLYADQMVSALQAVGARVRYTVLKGAEHNIPSDLDGAQVIDWYLRQRRSHAAAPADPRDSLGLNDQGFTPWTQTTLEAGQYWTQDDPELSSSKPHHDRSALLPLIHRALAYGEQIDAPLLKKMDLLSQHSSTWLAVPKSSLRTTPVDVPDTQKLQARKAISFVFKGKREDALKHLEAIKPELQAAGISLSDTLWIKPLNLWQFSPNGIAEYSVELKQAN
ncbi:MAG: hypothetical protein WC378_15050 [Opitutaceae bacterium]